MQTFKAKLKNNLLIITNTKNYTPAPLILHRGLNFQRGDEEGNSFQVITSF